MNRDLVSIIIPVYNVEEYLDECVDSILKQSYDNIELILINDGSTDDSGKICDEYAKSNKQIRAIHQKNKGVSAARNQGLRMAKGQYILFVDGDDVARDSLIKSLIEGFDGDRIGMTICDFSRFAGNDKIFWKDNNQPAYKIMNREQVVRELFYGNVVGSGPFCKLIKRSIISDIRFDESIKIGEDFDFLSSLLFSDDDFKINQTSQKLYGYRVREGSAMTGKFGKKDMDYLRLVKKWGDRAVNVYPNSKRAVAHRMFGVASYCAGRIANNAKSFQSEYRECNVILKRYSNIVLFDVRTGFKDRYLALIYTLNTRFASWLRRLV